MTSINRAKTTIEELKKLFSKGRKPSEEDFARLIDTLNDEIDSEVFYTKESLAAEFSVETAEELWNQSTMKFGFFEKKNNQYIKIKGGNE